MSTKVKVKAKKTPRSRAPKRAAPLKKTLKVVTRDEDDLDEEEEEDEEDDFEDELDDEDEEETDDEETDSEARQEVLEAGEADEEEAPPITDAAGYDIFAEFAEPLVQKGHPVYPWIVRDGVTQGRRDMPYSLDALIKEFGSGTIRVFIKDAVSHRILKQHTYSLGRVPANGPVASATAPVDPLGIVALMQENQQAAKREMAEQTTKDKDVLGALMQSMMQSQLAQGQQTQQFMQMMVTQQMQVMEKINSSSQQMFQLIQGQISAMTSKQTEKPLSAIELITMLEKTKASSVEQYEAMLERIESKASDKAEILERIESLARKEPAEKPSSFDRMIELLAPVVGQIAAAQAAASQGAAAPQPALPVKEEPRPPTQVLPREAPKVTVPKAAPGFEAPPGLRPAPGFPRIEKSETSKTVAPESLNGKHGPKEVVSSVLPTPAQKPAEPSGAGAKA